MRAIRSEFRAIFWSIKLLQREDVVALLGIAFFLVIFLPIPFVHASALFGYWTPRLVLPALVSFFLASALSTRAPQFLGKQPCARPKPSRAASPLVESFSDRKLSKRKSNSTNNGIVVASVPIVAAWMTRTGRNARRKTMLK